MTMGIFLLLIGIAVVIAEISLIFSGYELIGNILLIPTSFTVGIIINELIEDWFR